MKTAVLMLVVLIVLICVSTSVEAGVPSYLARETAEFVMKKFGKEAAEQGAEVLTRRISGLASRYGDDVLKAFQRVGPKVSKLADEAGEHAPIAMRLLAGHGDDVVRLVARPKQLGLVARLGDDAAECLLKHGEAVEPLLHSFGKPAVKALRGLSSQNGRRLSMMLADGQLAKLGRSDELLSVVARYGDTGASWVWRNAGALAVGTTLAAFLAAPEKFIDGGTDLATVVADAMVKPLVVAAAESFPWAWCGTVVGLVGGIVASLWGIPRWLAWKKLRAVSAAQLHPISVTGRKE